MRKKLFVAYILALALNTIAGNVATQTSSSAKTYCHFRPMASGWEERIDEANAEHDYTLFSDGMPSEAVVIINGQEFRGLNAQGDAHIKSAKLETANVKVKVGGGYVAKVTVDNANYQIDVKFIQLFTPTISVYNPQNEAFLHSRTSRAISQNETYRRNTPYPPLKNRPAYAGIHIL